MRKTLKSILMLSLVLVYLLVGFQSVFAIERVTVAPATTRAKADKNYMFRLENSNVKFILLDETEEGYFVLTEKYVGTRPLSASGEAVPFDPANPDSVAYWLNGEFLESGYFPQEILDNIVERVYKTEGGGSKVPFSKDYETKCKIVLLSQTEWSKYNARFGHSDDGSVSFWGLRTVRELTGAPLVAAQGSPNTGLTVEGKWTSSTGLRAAFYLPKDFFQKVSLDLDATGDAILSLVRNKNDLSTLYTLYNTSAVDELVDSDIPPMADGVYIIGRGIVGETVKGYYNFLSLDAKDEDGTMIQWQRSKNGTTWSTIVGATEENYVPSKYDVGCTIRMKVTPMTDTMSGASYESVSMGPIRAISKPVASNIKILSENGIKPGSILDAKYSFTDENRDICSGTDYVWQISSDKTTAQNVGEGRYYKLASDDAGKYVRVGVTPMKKTLAEERVTIVGDTTYSEWVAVENLPLATDVKLTRTVDMTVTATKTDNGVSLTSALQSVGSDDQLTTMYTLPEGNDFEAVCQWEAATSEDGDYVAIATNTESLDYSLDRALWVRAKVYTKNSEGVGNPTYSEPIYIGSNSSVPVSGELSASYQMTAGKTYEIWISNNNVTGCYAYSFGISGSFASVSSAKYLTNKITKDNKTYVIGTLKSGVSGDGYTFKAGEITADAEGTLTISDVILTAPGTNGVSQARVFIVEK